MIDSKGFRLNVGIIICNRHGKVFWGKRLGESAWQFPQGGIDYAENPEQAMYRELFEETGLRQNAVEIIACTQDWLHYRLPKHMLRYRSHPLCVGQKQRWFLLRLVADESCFNLKSTGKPEFDQWRWVDYWHAIEEVVFFKREVYQQALSELSPFLRHQQK